MKSWIGAMLALFAAFGPAQAAGASSKEGDFYIISRGSTGEFLGSHKIFLRAASGLHQVQYCGQAYWVRPQTVAWSQIEQTNKRFVRIEYNRGLGWRPLCNRPGDQVTVADIGFQMEPRYVLGSSDAGLKRVNRFAAIAESFRGASGGRAARSYHGQ
ncbi:hypothetical protein GCM10011316_16250 [Roseibium aquae]|uniref:Uncharacterized protein n=1 Tax=Roseibium aquae TaxID=1323746 RepID=A0A916TH69_9HYPH|nr:hypothetical protein [Roseibium aquae]GGB44999.1 hypothetical protein GCM10011316_16250 [Roseibium aquae]